MMLKKLQTYTLVLLLAIGPNPMLFAEENNPFAGNDETAAPVDDDGNEFGEDEDIEAMSEMGFEGPEDSDDPAPPPPGNAQPRFEANRPGNPNAITNMGNGGNANRPANPPTTPNRARTNRSAPNNPNRIVKPTPRTTPRSNPRTSPAKRAPRPTPTKKASAPGLSNTKLGKANKNAPPKPKLSDYLELDPSVKNLEVKNFDLPDREVRDVVTLISKWTGKNFILDSKVRGKITIMGPSQVTLQEAYHAFLSALAANGLTTVQSGKFIRIIESAEARRSPVKTYSGDFAPSSDQFITRIYQLKYINADEVQREFRDMTTRQGKLFAYEPTNSIIVTDTGSNIQRIIEILKTLDVKSFETSLHVLPIKYGSSKTISEMLSEIYGQPGKKTGSSRRSFKRSSLERSRGGGIITKIIPDDSTNSLVVLANEQGLASLKRLVNKLDVKINDSGKIQVYYCEHAKATDLAETLAALAGNSSSSRSTSRRNTSRNSRNNRNRSRNNRSSSRGKVSAELDGGVKITADEGTNSLVIVANASDYQTLRRVIRKLDIPRLQVFIETAILELSVDDNNKYGVNLGFEGRDSPFGGGFLGDATLASFIANRATAPPSGLTIPFKAPFAQGSAAFKGGLTSFVAFINFLKQNTQTSVLSTPQIIALDNEEAVFKVQDEIPVATSFSQSTSTSTLPTTNIENKKVGIDIKLTPHINAKSKRVRLEIEQKVDSLKASGVPEGLSQFQQATTTRETNTTVIVDDGDLVMLGGLMSDRVEETETKVPLLGDIPILGWLFKSTTTDVVKSNLVILLRPRILDSSAANAKIVSENLDRREAFANSTRKGKDPFKEKVDAYRKHLEEQQNRSKGPLELRDSDEEEELERFEEKNLEPTKSEIEASKKRKESNIGRAEKAIREEEERIFAEDELPSALEDNDLKKVSKKKVAPPAIESEPTYVIEPQGSEPLIDE